MKIEDEKRLIEITMRVWNSGQYSQDLSVGLLVDGSFKHGQGAYKVDSVDEFTARAQQVKSDALTTDEAASLFDGGWRSSNYYQLMFERRCDKEEAAGICAALATFEQ